MVHGCAKWMCKMDVQNGCAKWMFLDDISIAIYGIQYLYLYSNIMGKSQWMMWMFVWIKTMVHELLSIYGE